MQFSVSGTKYLPWSGSAQRAQSRVLKNYSTRATLIQKRETRSGAMCPTRVPSRQSTHASTAASTNDPHDVRAKTSRTICKKTPNINEERVIKLLVPLTKHSLFSHYLKDNAQNSEIVQPADGKTIRQAADVVKPATPLD